MSVAARPINGLALCAGIGGLELGIERTFPGYRPVCYVEGEAFAAATLAAQMARGGLVEAPIWSDVRTFDPEPWRGKVDLVSGGYPCQPFSVAGKQRGSDDPRHLWPWIRSIVKAAQPWACVFENVPGHLHLGLEEVLSDLEGMGFRVAVGLFTAEEIGAPHRRERLFIVAQRDDAGQPASQGRGGRRRAPQERHDTWRSGIEMADTDHALREQPQPERGSGSSPEPRGKGEELADARSKRLEGEQQAGAASWSARRGDGTALATHRFPPGPGTPPELWPADVPQPAIRRGADGIPLRLDRIRALGNAVCPQQAELAIRTLWRSLNP